MKIIFLVVKLLLITNKFVMTLHMVEVDSDNSESDKDNDSEQSGGVSESVSENDFVSLLEERYRFVNDNTSKRFRITSDGRVYPESKNDRQLAWAFRTYAVRRIVGGMETTIHMYPYNVAISRNGKHWCGGSIIDEQWILSAGHCFESASDGDKRKLLPFIVRAGSSFHNHGGYQARVNKVFFPSDFSPGNADFDYALVRLDRPMPIGRNIAVLNLPAKDYLVENGDMLIVTGWGSTHTEARQRLQNKIEEKKKNFLLDEDTSGRSDMGHLRIGYYGVIKDSGYGHIPDRLRFVPVPIMKHGECQDAYHFYITPRMLCAGYATGGKDACNHDSGGPAVRDGVLIGIVSFGGKKCGDPRSPGVYSRVSEITEWVEDTITDNEACNVPELKAKIEKARLREKELKKFKVRVEEKKNKIKSWLRDTLKSPTFLEIAKKKLVEAGFIVRKNFRRILDEPELLDEKTLDEINLSNLINERILDDAEKDETELLLRKLAIQAVVLNSYSGELTLNEDGGDMEALLAYVI